MCGKFTQLASWQDVVAFSQPLTVSSGREDVVVATPMRFANILRLDAAGEREAIILSTGLETAGNRVASNKADYGLRTGDIVVAGEEEAAADLQSG